MTEWKKYTGSPEQIDEMRSAKDGFILEIIDVGEICYIEQTDILHWKDGMEEQLRADIDCIEHPSTILELLECKQ